MSDVRRCEKMWEDVRCEKMSEDVRCEKMWEDVRRCQMWEDVRCEKMWKDVRRCEKMSDVRRCQKMSDVRRCQKMSDVRRCQMWEDVKRCEKMSDVRRCQMWEDVRCEKMSDVRRCEKISDVRDCEKISHVRRSFICRSIYTSFFLKNPSLRRSREQAGIRRLQVRSCNSGQLTCPSLTVSQEKETNNQKTKTTRREHRCGGMSIDALLQKREHAGQWIMEHTDEEPTGAGPYCWLGYQKECVLRLHHLRG